MHKGPFLTPPTETVRTPSVRSRSDAWAAWESSLLGNRKQAKPHGTFAKRWHDTKAFLFKFELVKKNTGVIKYKSLCGHYGEREENFLVTGARYYKSNYNANFWIGKVAINEVEYPALAAAQKWIHENYTNWTQAAYSDRFWEESFQNEVVDVIFPKMSYKNVVLFSKYPEVFEAGWYDYKLHPEEPEMTAGWWTEDGFVRLDLKHGEKYRFWILEGMVADSLFSLLTAIDYYREHPEDKPIYE